VLLARSAAARAGVVVVGVAIALSFLFLYRHYGRVISSNHPFDTVTLFAMDVSRTVKNMTLVDGVGKRTKVHPIYVLLVNPVGSWLNGTPWPKRGIAIALNSTLAATAVLVLFCYVYTLRGSVTLAALLAGCFGFPMSHLVIGSVPETYSLAALSLLATHWLFLIELPRNRLSLWRWIAAGVFTLGVTTTNFVQTAICVAVLAWNVCDSGGESVSGSSARLARMFRALGTVTMGTIAAVILLAIGQKALYPKAELFFDPKVFRDELQYAHLLLFEAPLFALEQLGKNFFVFDLVGPIPHLIFRHGRNAVSFSPARAFSALGFAAVTWSASVAAYAIVRRSIERRDRPLLVAIVLCFAFNLALHSYYGMYDNVELFLYSGHFTFLLFLALAVAVPVHRATIAALALLVVLLAASNLATMNRVVAYCL
jgi:hypothetical protein